LEQADCDVVDASAGGDARAPDGPVADVERCDEDEQPEDALAEEPRPGQ